MPGVIVNRYGLGYREYIELFCGDFNRFGSFPVLSEIQTFLTETARAIQEGRQAEFVHSKEWLDIYWPPGEYIFIKLVKEGKLDAFYKEAERALSALMKEKGIDVPISLLFQTIKLNRTLVKEPFHKRDIYIELPYNIWDVYRQTLLGNEVELRSGVYSYIIYKTNKIFKTF